MSSDKVLWLSLRHDHPLSLSYDDNRTTVVDLEYIRNDTRVRMYGVRPKTALLLSPHWLTAIPTTLKPSASTEAKRYAVEPYLHKEDQEHVIFSRKKRMSGEGLMLYVVPKIPLQQAIHALSECLDIQALYLEHELLTDPNTLYLYPNPQGDISIILPDGSVYLSSHELLSFMLSRLIHDLPPECHTITWIGKASPLPTFTPRFSIQEQTSITLPASGWRGHTLKNEWPTLHKLRHATDNTDAHAYAAPSWRTAWPLLRTPLKQITYTSLSLFAVISIAQCFSSLYTYRRLYTEWIQLNRAVAPEASVPGQVNLRLHNWTQQLHDMQATTRTDALPMLTVMSWARQLAQLPPPQTLAYDTNTLKFQWTQFMPAPALDKMKALLESYGYHAKTMISLRGLEVTITDPLTTTNTPGSS